MRYGSEGKTVVLLRLFVPCCVHEPRREFKKAPGDVALSYRGLEGTGLVGGGGGDDFRFPRTF